MTSADWKSRLKGVYADRRPRRAVLLAAGGAVLLLTATGWWGIAARERSDMLELLQKFAPIARPPLEVQFPAILPASANTRSLLSAGQQAGFWVVRGSGNSSTLEVRITRDGQRLFSTVGNSIVAGFGAGTRSITRIEAMEDTPHTRHVQFRYVWTQIHPAMEFLGESAPIINKEYAGEAMLVRAGDSWTLAHWTIPDFDAAQRQFQALGIRD